MRDCSVTGLWQAITGALVRTGFSPTPVGDGGFGLADGARRRLARLVRTLDGSRDLVIDLAEGRVPLLVLHVFERRLDHEDEDTLARLRTGLPRYQSLTPKFGQRYQSVNSVFVYCLQGHDCALCSQLSPPAPPRPAS